MDKLLSQREFEIVEHLVYFGTKKEAAPPLAITERTMETHTKNIFRKLNITKLNELVLWYVGVKFEISDQIEAVKREVVIASRTHVGLLLTLFFTISILLNQCEQIRYRRYRREIEMEYIITHQSIGSK